MTGRNQAREERRGKGKGNKEKKREARETEGVKKQEKIWGGTDGKLKRKEKGGREGWRRKERQGR